MKRRWFFSALAKAAACVGLAPPLAFKPRPELTQDILDKVAINLNAEQFDPNTYKGNIFFIVYDEQNNEGVVLPQGVHLSVDELGPFFKVQYRLVDGKFVKV